MQIATGGDHKSRSCRAQMSEHGAYPHPSTEKRDVPRPLGRGIRGQAPKVAFSH
jgi:hypothetical protein